VDEMRKLLRDKADEMHLGTEMPSGLRKRARRRRVLNTAIALAVVGTVGFGSYAGFRIALEPTGDSRSATSSGADPFSIPALFPAPYAIPDIQRDAESGIAPGWLDARLVTLRFAQDVLGWTEEETHPRLLTTDPMRAEIWNPTLSVGGRRISTILTLRRYQGRSDGIWMVMSAASPDIQITSPQPWDTIRPGQTIQVQGRLGFNHEGGGLQATIGTVPGGTPTVRSISYKPDFTFTMQAPPERAVAAAFTMFDAEGTSVATTSFRLHGLGSSSTEDPRVAPSPGPTPPRDMGRTLTRVSIVDGVGVQGLARYAGVLVGDSWLAEPYTGYVTEPGHPRIVRGYSTTVLFIYPGFEAEGERLRHLFFPGAQFESAQAPPGEIGVGIVLGKDFAQTHAEGVAALATIDAFMQARISGSGAESFLSNTAMTQYEAGDLSLYTYAEEGRYNVAPFSAYPRTTPYKAFTKFLISVWNTSEKSYSEVLRVGSDDASGPRIADVSLMGVAREVKQR
jgi:hypothetical protein